MAIQLYDYQREALNRMKNGCILCGGVGSGKSRTGLAYYYLQEGGQLGTDDYIPMKNPRDLYIITTARKRDTCEWQGDLAPFLLSPNPDANYYKNKVIRYDSEILLKMCTELGCGIEELIQIRDDQATR